MLEKVSIRTIAQRCGLFSFAFLLAGAFAGLAPRDVAKPEIRSAVGDSERLAERYRDWKRQLNGPEARPWLVISLVHTQQHEQQHARSAEVGSVELDFATHTLRARVYTGEPGERLGLWATRDAGATGDLENAVFVGDFSPASDGRGKTLEVPLSELGRSDFQLAGFAVLPFAVLPEGGGQLQARVAAGSPNLFQRLYALERSRSGPLAAAGSRAGLSLVPVAHAASAGSLEELLSVLVARGEEVFFEETFEGNGRSCGTCHPATHNFTIDAEFIAGLPGDDPLFVAEFIPELIFGAPENLLDGEPQRFENPLLMREFGLIVENVDGMSDLRNRFTMRSVPHNIGMSVSVTRPAGSPSPPEDRTGWSGDGAPSGLVGGVPASGRLRDFVLGAIVQHYPKTLARSFGGPEPDFRIATDEEILAVEAFILSLGRQGELDIGVGSPSELVLRDPSAEAGKILFRDGVPGGTRTCNGCHANAGANVSGGGNRSFNTGVEAFLQNRITDPDDELTRRPIDGGFGTTPDGGFDAVIPRDPARPNEDFGDQTFNTVSLVEAADTPPFFHNNSVETLEGSIAFYNSPEFIAANGGSIPFSEAQIAQVANFLRVINALDNVENSAQRQATRALAALEQSPVPNDLIGRMLDVARADTEDAIEVLLQGGLHHSGGLPGNAVAQLQRAAQRFSQAANPQAAARARANHLEKAEEHLERAVELMRE